MNLNELAKRIILKENKNKHLSVTQVKGIIRLVIIEMSKMDMWDLDDLIDRYRRR